MTAQTSTNAPSNLAKDHPAFQRAAAFLHTQVEKCRPSAIQIATKTILRQELGLTTASLPTRIADEVSRMEMAMFKRLARKQGLNSKYQGH